jgi:hypothetical protein
METFNYKDSRRVFFLTISGMLLLLFALVSKMSSLSWGLFFPNWRFEMDIIMIIDFK